MSLWLRGTRLLCRKESQKLGDVKVRLSQPELADCCMKAKGLRTFWYPHKVCTLSRVWYQAAFLVEHFFQSRERQGGSQGNVYRREEGLRFCHVTLNIQHVFFLTSGLATANEKLRKSQFIDG
jgi:hypothetical protein